MLMLHLKKIILPFSAEAAVVTVYDANGNTIANQEVTLTNSNGTIVAKGLTDR